MGSALLVPIRSFILVGQHVVQISFNNCNKNKIYQYPTSFRKFSLKKYKKTDTSTAGGFEMQKTVLPGGQLITSSKRIKPKIPLQAVSSVFVY